MSTTRRAYAGHACATGMLAAVDPQTYLHRRTRALAVSGLAHALEVARPEDREQVLERWVPILRRLEITAPR